MVIKPQKRLLLAIVFESYVRSSVNSRLPEDEIAEFLTTFEPPLNGPPLNNGHFFWRTLHTLTFFSNLSTTVTFFCPPRWPLRRGSTVKINGSKKIIRKTYCSIDAIYFYRSICKKKNCVYILKLWQKIGQSLEESLRGAREVSLLRNEKYFE